MVETGSSRNYKETPGGGGGGERAMPAAGGKIDKLIIKIKPPAEKKEEEAAAPPHRNLSSSSAAAAVDQASNRKNKEREAPLPLPLSPQRHWDLRPRGKKRPFFAAETENMDDKKKSTNYKYSSTSPATVSDIPRRMNASRTRDEKKPIFRRTLTNEEIEEDLLAMTGHLPRPPKRRKPKDQSQNVVLGSDMPKTITENRYRVSRSSY